MWRSLPLGKVANFVRLIQLGNKVESAPGIWVEFPFPWKTGRSVQTHFTGASDRL